MVVVLTTYDITVGISTITMILIGYGMGIYTLRKWLQVRQEDQSSILLFSAIMFITLPSPWMASFFLVMIEYMGLPSLNYNLHIFLASWSVPVFSLIWMYITGSLFKDQPWLKKLILATYSILGFVYYYMIFIVRDWEIKEMDDTALRQVILGDVNNMIVIIYGISALLFIFPVYLWFSTKTANPLYRFRFRMTSLSALIFVVAGVIDAVISDIPLSILVINRLLLTIALFCLYLGYITPRVIRNKFE